MAKRLQLSLSAEVPDNVIDQSAVLGKIKPAYDALQQALKDALSEASLNTVVIAEAKIIAPPKAPRQRKPKPAAAVAGQPAASRVRAAG